MAFRSGIGGEQRGAGESTPHACVQENPTWDLVNDIEKLREHLGIEKWMVFGGSWGSTLALTYAQSHPEKVTGIVLRGIFRLRRRKLTGSTSRGHRQSCPMLGKLIQISYLKKNAMTSLTVYSKWLKSSDHAVQAFARVENHYFINKGFLPTESYILDNVHKLRHIPALIVQGRYDVSCAQ